VAGKLPLDLEIRRSITKAKLRKTEITQQEYKSELDGLIGIWQDRYDQSDKGEWTKKMIPNVSQRYVLPMRLDHYTSQILTGRGDFLAQLHRFKLANNPNCKCNIGGAETVAHVRLKCK